MSLKTRLQAWWTTKTQCGLENTPGPCEGHQQEIDELRHRTQDMASEITRLSREAADWKALALDYRSKLDYEQEAAGFYKKEYEREQCRNLDLKSAVVAFQVQIEGILNSDHMPMP